MTNPLSAVRRNWKSGVTVSLVSVPLSLSLAIAGGATPLMGIITAIWAGLAGGMLAGSRFNIVGPTGALSGILAIYATRFGVGILPLLAIGAGVFILIAYVLRWDKYIVFIPSSVTHGFTLGVAFIIGLNQLNFALGLPKLPAHEGLIANILESMRHIAETDAASVTVFLVGFLLLFLIVKLFPRVPGAIVVAVLGIALGMGMDAGWVPFSLQTLASRYGNLDAALWQPIAFPTVWSTSFITGSATIALVALLETLLSAKIADGMTKTKFDQKREVLALGVANIASGLTGGIPATAALARTALNIRSGASSQVSAIINALSVALLSLVFFPQFRFLPLPVVAAILVYVAVRMVSAEHYRTLFRLDRTMFWLSLVVAALTIIEDPIIGILVGSSVSLLIFAKQLSKGQSEVSFHKDQKMIARVSPQRIQEFEQHADVTVYRFAGELTYINGQAHMEMLKRITGAHTIILSLRNLFYIDIDGLDVLHEIVEDCEGRGKRVVFSGASEYIAPVLGQTDWYECMREEGRVFQSTSVALRELGVGL